MTWLYEYIFAKLQAGVLIIKLRLDIQNAVDRQPWWILAEKRAIRDVNDDDMSIGSPG